MIKLTISELVNSLTNLLSEKLDTARLDVEVLVTHALKWQKAKLYSHSDYVLTQEEQDTIADLINRRLNGEPIAYITGCQEFWSLPFTVTTATLIPRPETEHLVEETLKKIAKNKAYSILDLGTGTGAIAIAIAHERPESFVTAVDFSRDALSVAIENQKRLKIDNVKFLQGNWFENLQGKHFDIIVSNPPYIAEQDPHLSQGDVIFEPDTALTAGEDGLQAIREIISKAKTYMNDSGWLLFEHGYQQAEAVRNLLQENNFHSIATVSDLANNERVTLAQK